MHIYIYVYIYTYISSEVNKEVELVERWYQAAMFSSSQRAAVRSPPSRRSTLRRTTSSTHTYIYIYTYIYAYICMYKYVYIYIYTYLYIYIYIRSHLPPARGPSGGRRPLSVSSPDS